MDGNLLNGQWRDFAPWLANRSTSDFKNGARAEAQRVDVGIALHRFGDEIRCKV
jgi:hypothetical protein